MKDALDTVKYILRKLLLDEKYQNKQTIQKQECSWNKMLTSNTDTTFRQYIGEKLLDISRTVIIRNLFYEFSIEIFQIQFSGATGTVDFDSIGLRRSIRLKVLDLSENGMVEVGTWTSTNRLSITQLGVQQLTAIRKYLQVVTREVMKNKS
jgi:hypothetical protein